MQLKGAEDVLSPRMSRTDAEADLAEIRRVLSHPDPREAMLGVPEVSWFSGMGQYIIGASLVEADDVTTG